MISPIFINGRSQEIASVLTQRLNQRDDLVLHASGSSGVGGDLIERAIGEELQDVLGEDLAGDYAGHTGQRSLADVLFTDRYGFHHAVNVKGSNLCKTDHRPNLVSADRVRKFYFEHAGKPYSYDLMVVRYLIEDGRVRVTEILFFPIQWLTWDSLTVEAQGRGVIQLRNGLKIGLDPDQNREEWITKLIHVHKSYYDKQARASIVRADKLNRELDIWNALCSTSVAHFETVPVTTDSQIALFDD